MRYSQREEQDYILRAVEGMPHGRFMDIGAYDGVQFSNTMALADRGWCGVMVEPGIEAFRALANNHERDESITLIHAAVDLRPGLIHFWDSAGSYGTTEELNFKRFRKIGEFSDRPIYIPTITFQDLMPWITRGIDVLSIDTEGTSVDLLLAFPTQICKPLVVCVEHDARLQECSDWAKANGYKALMANVENLIFVRQEQKA